MFGTMIPESFAGVLAAYAACFQARSYPTFQWLVLGWVQCWERRTLTAVALRKKRLFAGMVMQCAARQPIKS